MKWWKVHLVRNLFSGKFLPSEVVKEDDLSSFQYMRCMVECTPINVLQLLCWPITSFHHQPITISYDHLHSSHSWQYAYKTLVVKQQLVQCIARNSCKTLIGVHEMQIFAIFKKTLVAKQQQTNIQCHACTCMFLHVYSKKMWLSCTACGWVRDKGSRKGEVC